MSSPVERPKLFQAAAGFIEQAVGLGRVPGVVELPKPQCPGNRLGIDRHVRLQVMVMVPGQLLLEFAQSRLECGQFSLWHLDPGRRDPPLDRRDALEWLGGHGGYRQQ